MKKLAPAFHENILFLALMKIARELKSGSTCSYIDQCFRRGELAGEIKSILISHQKLEQ